MMLFKFSLWIGLLGICNTFISQPALATATVKIRQLASPVNQHIVQAVQYDLNSYYRGSVADVDRAIKLRPNDAIAYKNRGDLKIEKLQDIQGALTDYDYLRYATRTSHPDRSQLCNCLPQSGCVKNI